LLTALDSLLLYYLADRPDVWAKMRAEVEGITKGQIPKVSDLDIDALKNAPYLNSVIKEVLRLHPAVRAGSRREVVDDGATFLGHYLPPGTDAVVALGAMQRSEMYASLATLPIDTERPCRHYAPDPDGFHPERWLDSESNKWQTNKEAFAPFSVGRRGTPVRTPLRPA
jgi:cytochrome P450